MPTSQLTSPVHSKQFKLDGVQPEECFHLLRGPKIYWSAPDCTPILAAGHAAQINASGENRFTDLKDKANRVFEQIKMDTGRSESPPETVTPRFFGGLSFRNNVSDDSKWSMYDAGQFYLPEIQLSQSSGETWISINKSSKEAIEERHQSIVERLNKDRTSEPRDQRHIEQMSHYPRRQQWLRNVQETLLNIRNGKLDKLVLAQQMNLRFDRPLDSEYLIPTLHEAGKNTYRFLFKNNQGITFLGASPETLIHRQGSTVETESLAGTVESGRNAEEKQVLAEQLASNPKNQKEHEFVVETLRDRLKQFTSTINRGEQTVKSFPSVQHLYTPIEGTLAGDVHVLELARSLHPTPAVGGSPASSVEKYRREYEPFERGWYASPVGWFDREGNGRFSVAIRSALVQGRDATLYAGAGLVEDSQPENEWDEVQWKFQSLLDILRV